jgi:hypothetical protein
VPAKITAELLAKRIAQTAKTDKARVRALELLMMLEGKLPLGGAQTESELAQLVADDQAKESAE